MARGTVQCSAGRNAFLAVLCLAAHPSSPAARTMSSAAVAMSDEEGGASTDICRGQAEVQKAQVCRQGHRQGRCADKGAGRRGLVVAQEQASALGAI